MPTSAATVPTENPRLYPAFKEWQVIVDALVAGEQSLLLRKGGIAEGREGFDSERAERFWLFPTQFHAQREKTKPALTQRLNSAPGESSDTRITLTAYAEVTHRQFLSDWSAVAALDPFHGWTAATVREKFDWSQPSGVHALVVQVHRLHEPITLERTAAMAGCKSWIGLPVSFDAYPSAPVAPMPPIAQLRSALAIEG
jgi:hypothetical protein